MLNVLVVALLDNFVMVTIQLTEKDKIAPLQAQEVATLAELALCGRISTGMQGCSQEGCLAVKIVA